MASSGSDSVNVSSSGAITCKTFKGKEDEFSYEDYKNRITCIFELKEVEEVIEPGFVVPASSTTDADEKKKIKNDRYARTWIKMTTSGNPHYLVKNCATALEMMQMLDAEYELGKESYDMETLDMEFDNMVLEDGDQPSVFFVKLEELNVKYDQFQEANGKQYKKDERELIIKISNSVGEKYAKLIEVWKTKRDTSKTQKELYDDLKKVLNEYYKTHFSKLTELKGNGSKKRGLIMQMGVDDNVKCSHCGKNHASEKCWIKFPHLRPNNKNKFKGKPGNGGKKQGACWVCGGDHNKKDCPNRKKNGGNNGSAVNGMFLGVMELKSSKEVIGEEPKVEEKVEKVISNTIKCLDKLQSKTAKYLLDSGSQTHALCDESIQLRNEKQVNDRIQGFDGSAVTIKIKGDLTLRDISTGSAVILHGARKSGFIKKNIISSGQLQKEGWILRGNDDLVILKRGNDILRFVTSNGEDNLYYMEAATILDIPERDITNAFAVDEVIDPDAYIENPTQDDEEDDDDMPPPLDEKANWSDDSDDEDWSDDESDDDLHPPLVQRNYDSDSSEESEWSCDNGDTISAPRSWSDYDSDDDDETWKPVGTSLPQNGDFESWSKRHNGTCWGRVFTTSEGQTAVIMNATTDNTPDSGPAIVSDSESDDDDNVTETSDKKTQDQKKTVSFDDGKTKHPKGILKTGGTSQRKSTSNVGDPIPVKKEDIDINVAHNQWGHHGIRRLQEMARVNGFRLTGDLKPCDACGISKASQTRVYYFIRVFKL
jgi:hypothetical protein